MTQTVLEIEEVQTGLRNDKKYLKEDTGMKKDDENNEIRNKWRNTAEQVLERQRSWKLIDGSIDEIHWSSTDDCWRWLKRFLTIGNIGVVTVCFCLLMGSSYVCFSR